MTTRITPFQSFTQPGGTDTYLPADVDNPIAVLASFTVEPNGQSGWVNLWAGIAQQAATWPGCRSFQILSDRNDTMYCLVMSEWDSLEAYNDFARDSRMGWVMQTMRQISVPGEYRFLNVAGGIRDDRTGCSE